MKKEGILIEKKKNWNTTCLKDVEKITLASQSPRRKELLRYIIPSFDIKSANINEEKIVATYLKKNNHLPLKKKVAIATAQLAHDKCKSVSSEPKELLIGADTTVLFKNQILGKPKTKKEAKNTLRKLLGHSHIVITGVCFYLSEDCYLNFSVQSKVSFVSKYSMLDQIIDDYVDQGHAMDKAGSYGIQKEGAIFIESIQGDDTNIMGLPVSLVSKKLFSAGLSLNYYNNCKDCCN